MRPVYAPASRIGPSFDPDAQTTIYVRQRGGDVMSRLTACVKATILICAGLAGFLSQPDSAAAFNRNQAQLFAVLPDGGTLPEGLAVAPNGDVYVATFDGSKKIFGFHENRGLLRALTANSSGFLLGLGDRKSVV